MMVDQLNEYVRFLCERGIEATSENGQIKINTEVERQAIILWCKLGDFFPYEIPEIYIDLDTKKQLPSMAHFYTNNNLCVFDKSRVIPNFKEPNQLLVETIQTAISVIEKGIRGETKNDYIDEFLEYWSTKAKGSMECFIETLTEAKQIYYAFIGKKNIISDNEERLDELSLAICGESLNKKDVHEGILIPIDMGCIEKIPRTDIDIVDLIEKKSTYSEKYVSFIRDRIDEVSLVLLSYRTDESDIIFGWVHLGPGTPEGFRKGREALKYAFSKSGKKGFPMHVDNCHQNRIFKRGGDGRTTIWKSAGIIGCGSIGSYVAEALKMSGTEKFVLVDNETIGFENIARHACGYRGVGIPKTISLGVMLQADNPNIMFDSYIENAHAFVEKKWDVINECDVLFVAVADFSIEHHVNKLVADGQITIPVVILWVEPYCLGGHALYIKKPQDLFDGVFDPCTFTFSYGIVKNSFNYLKREGGCQSTYMPYSGFQIQQFVYRILDYIATECWNWSGNYRVSWCGKLSEANSLGVELNEEYRQKEDFSIIYQRID